MAFTFTRVEEQENTVRVIPEGEYEVIIEKVELQANKDNTNKCIFLQYRIREDVDQEYKRFVIFERIWQNRETHQFNLDRLNRLLSSATKLADGKVFNTLNEVLEELKDSKLRVVVKIEHDDYRDEDRNFVYFYKSSKVQATQLSSTTSSSTTSSVEITENDLPF